MKFYKHKISLIERTKSLEGIVCQSITVTNVLGKQWGQGDVFYPSNALTYFSHNERSANLPTSWDDDIENQIANFYKTPIVSKNSYTIVSASFILYIY